MSELSNGNLLLRSGSLLEVYMKRHVYWHRKLTSWQSHDISDIARLRSLTWSSLGTNRHCPSRGTVEDRFLRPLFFLWSHALPTQALTVWVHRLLLFSLGAGASLPPRYRKLHYTAFRGSAGRNNQPSVDFTDVPSYSSHPSPRDGWL